MALDKDKRNEKDDAVKLPGSKLGNPVKTGTRRYDPDYAKKLLGIKDAS